MQTSTASLFLLIGVSGGALSLAAGTAHAQGCVVARQSTPVSVGVGSPFLSPGDWQASVGSRWFRSQSHFVGSEAQPEREHEGSQVINDVALFDLDLALGLTPRVSVGVGLPYLIAERSGPIRDAEGAVVARNRTRANGAGDIVLSARSWLLDPQRYPKANLQGFLGLKLPTGADNMQDSVRMLNGSPTVRTVDQSIQPGDGGIGVILGLQSHAQVSLFHLFASGSYLLNPRGTNGVPTYRGRAGEAFMSVPDAYIARAGTFVSPPGLERLGVGAGFRVEGVPAEDLLGSSDGFRRPGYTVAAEPALALNVGNWTVSASAPIALYRNRTRSVADKRDGTHGDAAFADYSLLFGISYRIPGRRTVAQVDAATEPSLTAATNDREPGTAGGLRDLQGQSVRLERLLHKRLTVVNLWGSWCAPCRAELPVLAEVSRKFQGAEVGFVGIAVNDRPSDVSAAVHKFAIAYPVFMGDATTLEGLKTATVPTTFLLGPGGEVIEAFREPVAAQRLIAAIDGHLGSGPGNEPKPAAATSACPPSAPLAHR